MADCGGAIPDEFTGFPADVSGWVGLWRLSGPSAMAEWLCVLLVWREGPAYRFESRPAVLRCRDCQHTPASQQESSCTRPAHNCSQPAFPPDDSVRLGTRHRNLGSGADLRRAVRRALGSIRSVQNPWLGRPAADHPVDVRLAHRSLGELLERRMVVGEEGEQRGEVGRVPAARPCRLRRTRRHRR